jgi:hypothetical protein
MYRREFQRSPVLQRPLRGHRPHRERHGARRARPEQHGRWRPHRRPPDDGSAVEDQLTCPGPGRLIKLMHMISGRRRASDTADHVAASLAREQATCRRRLLLVPRWQRPTPVNDHDVSIVAGHGRFPCSAAPAGGTPMDATPWFGARWPERSKRRRLLVTGDEGHTDSPANQAVTAG